MKAIFKQFLLYINEKSNRTDLITSEDTMYTSGNIMVKLSVNNISGNTITCSKDIPKVLRYFLIKI